MSGDGTYSAIRDTVTWGRAATIGFIPIPFNNLIFTWPIQFGLFLFFTLVLIFVFSFHWYTGIFMGYILQGLVVMVIAEKISDIVLDWGFGVPNA